MASEVDICNLALGHLGQSRQITSISPPDGSVEAALCSRFYPLARDLLLRMHPWSFATKRVGLALSGTPSPAYEFSYAWPNGALNIQQILLEGSSTPQEYAIEGGDNTNEGEFIYTNVEDAQAKYTARITDVNRFTEDFRFSVSEMLASMLAGPIVKGKAGRELAVTYRESALAWFGQSAESDAVEQKEQVTQPPRYGSIRVESPSRRSRR